MPGRLSGKSMSKLYLKLWRDIRQQKWQFTALVVVILLGVLTYGGMMGIFLMGRSFKVFNERAAIAGVVISIAFNLLIVFATDIFWLWYVCIGFAVSFGIGVSINLVIKD